MEAIVLAGGLGTRLRPVVADVPKPMAPVAGRPFLAILLENLARQGFSRAVLAVGYKHEVIHEAFGDSFAGLDIRYAVEDTPLGTGGAIRLATQQCKGREIFVLNGDTYVTLAFDGMLHAHRNLQAKLTVCAVQVDDAGRYGSLLLKDHQIVGFSEKGVAGPGLINAGVYLLENGLLEHQGLPDVFSFERDVLEFKASQLRPMAYIVRGGFIDIGIPEDYLRAQDLFA